MTIAAGTKLGRYEIHSKIGEGGMGEVYLAQDTKLDRTVAIKVLPADLANNQVRLRRFGQEAKAASALNHPNIITIYEIDETDSAHFMATEFIDGETLRARMRRAPMKLVDLLDTAAQIAAALTVAHAAGIVHRDIKPENIMLRPDGYVKVLDFGLAKLIEPERSGSEDPTRALINTSAGVVMGTVAYMSPEQARGLEVDARTDTWSLGVVIYEMMTRHVPFRGETNSDIVVSILEREPDPVTQYSPQAPGELTRIVRKALAKDRDSRYQSARDLMVDLKNLRRDLDSQGQIERSTPASPEPVLDLAKGRSVPEAQPSRPKQSRKRAFVIVIALLAICAMVAGYWWFFRSAVSAPSIDSIAVLPLANTSNDPATEYVSDGISETLINSLTELQQLRVIARTTAFRYKGRDVDPKVLGRELNVRAVLMGRVRQMGDELNVQVDLVDTATGAQLWGHEYESNASDLLTIKQTIAREVVNKLRMKLSGEEQRKLEIRDTKNAEAYQFYLRGRFFQGKRTAESLNKAIEEFQQAIAYDPNYALGYVGLADSYSQLEQSAGMPASETLPKAKAAADRALQIDDRSAEAHTSLAGIYLRLWRWPEAESEFKRAISLNPNYPTAHQGFAYYLRNKLRFEEAMEEIKKAQDLDPLSPVIGANAAFAYLLKNDLNRAIEQDQKVLELDPDFWIAHNDMGWAYLKQKRTEQAVAEFQKAVDLSGRASLTLGNMGLVYAVMGRRAEAMTLAKELEARYAKHEAIGFFIATVYAGLGDRDQAFAWLEKDFQQRSGQLPYITWWPNFENLRDDQRFADLVRRMGL